MYKTSSIINPNRNIGPMSVSIEIYIGANAVSSLWMSTSKRNHKVYHSVAFIVQILPPILSELIDPPKHHIR
jgi:hypothetical protein